MFFLEHFCTIGIFLKSFMQTIKFGFRFLKAKEKIAEIMQWDGYRFYEISTKITSNKPSTSRKMQASVPVVTLFLDSLVKPKNH